MFDDVVIVYTRVECPNTQAILDSLITHNKEYRLHYIGENRRFYDFIKRINNGYVITPVLVFDDDQILKNPTRLELNNFLSTFMTLKGNNE